MTTRPLFCPVCGAKVMVPVIDAEMPEVHRLPEHESANGMNLCSCYVVTVTLSYDHCTQCGTKITKHPSGMCPKCYGKEGEGHTS